MSAARRLALLEWARGAGARIVEDDYDSEYRYEGRPLAALQGLDAEGRVIYVGTFSKVLFPSLRVGYLVAPPDLVDAFASGRALSDRQSPTVEQAILTDFIVEGRFSRHVRRVHALSAERQATLVKEIQRNLSGLLGAQPAEAGLHLVGWLPRGMEDREASRPAGEKGVEAPPLSLYRSGGGGGRRAAPRLRGVRRGADPRRRAEADRGFRLARVRFVLRPRRSWRSPPGRIKAPSPLGFLRLSAANETLWARGVCTGVAE